MDCEKYQKAISTLVDGELAADASAALTRHLSACADCRAMHQTMTALNTDLWREAPRVDSGLAPRVKAQIAGTDTKASGKTVWPLWSQAPVLAMLVLAALGLGNLAGRSMSEIIGGEPRETVLEAMVLDSTRSLADVVMDLNSEEQ
jgi:anti-sigma factor RsiW